MVKMDFAKVVQARNLHTPLYDIHGRCVLSKSKAKKEIPKTLVDDLVARLEGAIFRGEFPPGTRVREARIASQLGVGRGPLREAVRRLEGRKLVVRHPNRGTFIATLTPAELGQLLEVREALGVEACRLSATGGRAARVEAMEARAPECCERLMRPHLAHAQETMLHGSLISSPSPRKK